MSDGTISSSTRTTTDAARRREQPPPVDARQRPSGTPERDAFTRTDGRQPTRAPGEPPMPRARPDVPAAGVPDIRIDPRKPMGVGAGMGNQRAQREDVKKMQQRLQDLGYSVGRHVVDGKFGPDTERGVRDFQKANGLPETGKVDKATWERMRSDKAVKKENNPDPVAGHSNDPSQAPGFYQAWDRIAQRLKAGEFK